MNVLKELKASILTLVLYGLLAVYVRIELFASGQAEVTYEMKYTYMMWIARGMFFVLTAAYIAYLGGVMKKTFMWVEVIVIDIPAVLMLFSIPLYFALPVTWPISMSAFLNYFLKLGAAIIGCEAVRYGRYRKNGRRPYKRVA